MEKKWLELKWLEIQVEGFQLKENTFEKLEIQAESLMNIWSSQKNEEKVNVWEVTLSAIWKYINSMLIYLRKVSKESKIIIIIHDIIQTF